MYHEHGFDTAHMEAKRICLFTICAWSIPQLGLGCAEQDGILRVSQVDLVVRSVQQDSVITKLLKTLFEPAHRPWASDGQ